MTTGELLRALPAAFDDQDDTAVRGAALQLIEGAQSRWLSTRS